MKIIPSIVTLLFLIAAGTVSSPAQNATTVEPLLVYKALQDKDCRHWVDSVMDKLSFMIEILNFMVDKIDSCYYQLDERHIYYNATNDDYIRDFAEDHNYNWQQLANNDDSRRDLDCNPNQPIELTPDWGSAASFLEVAQERNYDFVTKMLTREPVDNNINEFFVKRDEEDDTMVNALMDKFCHYYRNHINKHLHYYRDRYGDARRANNKKSYKYF